MLNIDFYRVNEKETGISVILADLVFFSKLHGHDQYNFEDLCEVKIPCAYNVKNKDKLSITFCDIYPISPPIYKHIYIHIFYP